MYKIQSPTGHFECHNINKVECGASKWGIRPHEKHTQISSEQHMKQFSIPAYVIVVSSKIIKSQTSCFKREQVVPSSKSAGMRLCFLFSSSALFFFPRLFLPQRVSSCKSSSPVCQLQSCIIISKVLLNPLLLNTRMSSAC